MTRPGEVTDGFPESTVIWRTVWEWYLGVGADEDEVVDGEVVRLMYMRLLISETFRLMLALSSALFGSVGRFGRF